jgi:dUTP pyrophosphatase
MILKIKKLVDHAVMPERKTAGAVGFDLYTAEEKIIQPYHTELVGTGLSFELPYATEMQIRPRSSTFKNTMLDIQGTIDSDYRGEVKLMIRNLGAYPVEIKIGDRLAQAIINEVKLPVIEEAERLSDTDRGAGGFGSTGVNDQLKNLINEVIKND